MERILIFIKHNFGFLWNIIDGFNSLLFRWFFGSKMDKSLSEVLRKIKQESYTYKKFGVEHLPALYELIHSQTEKDLEYFSPHGFDKKSLHKQSFKSAFLMMGAFDEDKLVGYFFLRFFSNKKCFVGRLIDRNYRGKGIGQTMNIIMYETAWKMRFRCLSTISRNNKAVMGAHSKNPSMIILKELQNNYLLVEFIQKNQLVD